jgi:hypothetical protein
MAEIENNQTEQTEIVVEETAVWNLPPVRPRRVYAGMWGRPEIGAVAVAGIALLGSLLMYFLFVLPANRQLANNRSEADRLEAEVISAQSKYGEDISTHDRVGKLVTSVEDFETRYLPAVSNGQSAIYQRLNGLILANNLVNTSGPDYAPLETVDQNDGQQGDDEKGRAKFRSLYPGTYISTNVEGTYQDLRRFIREIETGNEFIVISAIELAPSDSDGKKKKQQQAESDQGNPVAANPGMMNPNQGAFQRPGAPQFPQQQFVQPQMQNQIKPKPGKMHGEIINLHIEMAAYFRRPNFAPTLPTMQ